VSSRDAYLKRKYGITEEYYEGLLEFQGGRCWICGYTPGEGKRKLAVDHDHKTGSVRGLLCHRCNRGLAWFSDNRDRLVLASLYVVCCPRVLYDAEKGEEK
jgi:hypothetical protein